MRAKDLTLTLFTVNYLSNSHFILKYSVVFEYIKFVGNKSHLLVLYMILSYFLYLRFASLRVKVKFRMIHPKNVSYLINYAFFSIQRQTKETATHG